MLIHNKDTFIVPVSPGDQAIIIQNIQGSVTFEIRPYSITAMFVDSNMVKVKSKASDKIISIHFLSNTESIRALVCLQEAIDLIKDQVPNISDDIKNYIDNKFLDLSLPTIVFRQSTPSCEWVVEHEIGKKVVITVLNDSFEEIETGVRYEGNNTIKILSNQDITGWVFA